MPPTQPHRRLSALVIRYLLIGLFLVLIVVAFHFLTGRQACTSEILSSSRSSLGYTATVEEVTCDSTMVNTDDYWVVMKGRWWFKRDTVVFNIVADRSTQPSIAWVDPKTLLITADEVSYLTLKTELDDGVTIRYQIGHIAHP